MPSDPLQSFGGGDEPFLDEVDREPRRCIRRPFGGAGLQQPKLAVFDGELDILNVAELALQSQQRRAQGAVYLRKLSGNRLLCVGIAPPGDDILALRGEKHVDDRLRAPRRRIARKGDACARARIVIAEDHGLNCDRGAL